MPPPPVLSGGLSQRPGCTHKAKPAQSTAKPTRRAAGSKRKRFRRSKQPANCRLLNLPGEIREQIFRNALVEYCPIIITEGVPENAPLGSGEPALLRVCKSIRAEARDIYYCENTFELLIDNCDVAGIFPFVKQYDSSAAKEKELRDFEFTFDGLPDPDNITSWMLMNHHYDGPPMLPSFAFGRVLSTDFLETILTSAIEISFLMRLQPCGALMAALNALWAAMDATAMDTMECDCCCV